jgi:hypothetical protein
METEVEILEHMPGSFSVRLGGNNRYLSRDGVWRDINCRATFESSEAAEAAIKAALSPPVTTELASAHDTLTAAGICEGGCLTTRVGMLVKERDDALSGDTVPRSRYDACNADWLREIVRADEIAAKAVPLIQAAEQLAAESERQLRELRAAIVEKPSTPYIPLLDYLRNSSGAGMAAYAARLEAALTQAPPSGKE